MNVRARVSNSDSSHTVEVATDGRWQPLAIAPKATGEPARDVRYRVQVQADAPQPAIEELIRATDALSEIQNTLRGGCAVRLVNREGD